jgi:hypothetical protein
MRRIAVRESALDAGVAAVRLAVAARHHAHDLLVLDLGFERTADAAIGTGRRHAATGRPMTASAFSLSAAVGHDSTQAPHERTRFEERLVLARTTRDSKPRPSIVSANVPWTSSQARTQREQAMHSVGSNSK